MFSKRNINSTNNRRAVELDSLKALPELYPHTQFDVNLNFCAIADNERGRPFDDILIFIFVVQKYIYLQAASVFAMCKGHSCHVFKYIFIQSLHIRFRGRP